MEFAHREEGAALDRIFITNTGNIPDVKTPVSTLGDDSWYQPGDLISLHYNDRSAPYTAQEMVRDRMLMEHHDLPYMVVMGTGNAVKGGSIIGELPWEETNNLIWGSPEGSLDTWMSARLNHDNGVRERRLNSVRSTAERWRDVILSGNHVWVVNRLDLGFSVDVLNYLNDILGVSTIDSVDILSQHLEHTELLNSYFYYEYQPPIRAGLRDLSQPIYDVWGSYADENTASVLLDLTKHSKYGPLWDIALEFTCTDANSSGCKVQSYSRMTLQLLGIQTDEINSWTDFAEYFAND